MTLRVTFLLAVLLAAILLAGCGGQDTPLEQAEEEAGLEELAPKEQPKGQAQGQSAFVGKHENLQPGDTAEWNAGMKITIQDVHIAPNESHRQAEKRQAKAETKAKKGKGDDRKGMPERALEDPEKLIAFSWIITNDGQTPINFNGELPCKALDANGLPLSRAEGSTAAELDIPPARNTTNTLEQPLEPGQTRAGFSSIPVPDAGAAELVCAYPPQQGGEPDIAQIPETGRATWVLDPAELEFRE